MSTQDLDPDPITTACAKSLEDFERDYMPPRSSYALYAPPPKPDAPTKSYKINLYKANTLHTRDLTACLNLIERTSGKHYRGSRLGWNGVRKRREMGSWDLRYLVVREVGAGWE
ncbi:43fde56b-c4a8-4ace-a6c5-b8e650cc91bb [Sclerotinia trifoliorum]|uniref:43fde56b-c4a8-4ace-a6c5-b8e650cc91bb n=1 Tax=Sclerotinia trifoliorum TaxID=28548 RepID=A0A8H2VZG6_9HELO|nr:43fde56b-c4a8-4ace-a6c5-b8e650cc91bb [Sclerotinia trifoliorum]